MLWYIITRYVSKISRLHTPNQHNSSELSKSGQYGFIGLSSEPSDVILNFLGIKSTFLAYWFSWFQLLVSSFIVPLYIVKTIENIDIILYKIMQQYRQRVEGFSFSHRLVGKIYRRHIRYWVGSLTLRIISTSNMSKSWVAKVAINLIVKMRSWKVGSFWEVHRFWYTYSTNILSPHQTWKHLVSLLSVDWKHKHWHC